MKLSEGIPTCSDPTLVKLMSCLRLCHSGGGIGSCSDSGGGIGSGSVVVVVVVVVVAAAVAAAV